MLGRPARQMPFQPVGDLLLTFPAAVNVDGYRRELDLDTAVARVTYVVGRRALRSRGLCRVPSTRSSRSGSRPIGRAASTSRLG